MTLFARLKTPLLANTGSTARDHLASERTFLAWIRTGLNLIALGIAVERFSQLDLGTLVRELRPTTTTSVRDDDGDDGGKEQTLVAGLLGTGSGSIVYGTARYFSNLRYIEAGGFKPAFHGVGVLNVAVAGVAGAAYWNTLNHGLRKNGQGHGHGKGKERR